jgi:hypothetical protein
MRRSSAMRLFLYTQPGLEKVSYRRVGVAEMQFYVSEENIDTLKAALRKYQEGSTIDDITKRMGTESISFLLFETRPGQNMVARTLQRIMSYKSTRLLTRHFMSLVAPRVL